MTSGRCTEAKLGQALPMLAGEKYVSVGCATENLMSNLISKILYSFILCCLFPSRQCLPPFSVVFSFDSWLPHLCFDVYPFPMFLASEGKKKNSLTRVSSDVDLVSKVHEKESLDNLSSQLWRQPDLLVFPTDVPHTMGQRQVSLLCSVQILDPQNP